MSLRDKTRRPTHPGAILREDVFPELGITQTKFAELLRISRQTLTQLMTEKRALSPEVAVRLAYCLDSDAAFWMKLQSTHDLWVAEQKIQRQDIIPLSQIKELT